MDVHNLLSRALSFVPWSVRSKIKRIPGLAQFQRNVVSFALDGREFAHRVDAGPAKGITFHVRLPEDKGIWTGAYEPVFSAHLASAVLPDTVAYDIGSWHGFFAGVMAAQGARQVHVFEPLPANADRIQRLIGLNPDRRILLHPYAVGDRDTVMDLLVMPQSSMAKLEESTFQADTSTHSRIRVPVRSIDSMIALGDAEPPALVKIDVEGAELLVLEGARNTLRAYHPDIFAEIHSSDLLTQCSILLQEESYRIVSLDEDRAAARAKEVFQIHATV